VLGTVPDAGVPETRRAIDAASRAFESASRTTANERAKWLRDLGTAIMDNQTSLAELLTREQGKPLAEAKGEVAMSANYIFWFAEEARRIYGDTIPSPWADRRIIVTRQSIGVVGAITPWNFPSSMLARKIGPALAAGCTIVAKPASQTPYSALAWGVLAEEVGIPAGVINIVTGDARAVGGELTSSRLVRKITFTGSTGVGKLLMKQAAETVKKVSMELGGNAPFIVFDDADLDKAVQGALAAKFRNAGQTCVCANRIYVQSGIHDRFAEALARATGNLKVGSGLDDGTTIGPLIDDLAVEKVEEFLEDALSKGAKIVVGGKRNDMGPRFFEPTVLTGASAAMNFARDEIFGPLAPVFQFETEDEAVNLSNDTEFGLAAYFYTTDLARAFRVSERLEYGIIGINEGIVTTEVAPFGGFKESGLGSEGSKYGVNDYLEMKYVCVGGLT
jgi:succinate-semialdehyde dehydrogenase/glutarate-semialdehyde dehydrogenase